MIGLARQAVGAVVIGLIGWLIAEFVHATPSEPLPACVCGHAAAAHEHYRRGVDCGACGDQVCAEYEPVSAEQLRAVELAEFGGVEEWLPDGSWAPVELAEAAPSAFPGGWPMPEFLVDHVLDGMRAPDPVADSMRERWLADPEVRTFLARRDAALGRPPLV